METFLIKSAIAMAILLALYSLLLEREKMHRFNRFYLLGSLMFSFAVPFITVMTYVKEEIAATVTAAGEAVISPAEGSANYWPYIGWLVYGLVTVIMLIRFTKNIRHFTHKVSQNPVVRLKKARLVLLEEKVLPHTFLNYIFINREEHESNTIEDELYTHELTHVRQKHTLDILFIEALKIIFWFNPLLYFYKKAIQLNHEFLADEKVIDTTANTIYYQNLLLEKAIVGTTFSMASNLNFSITKKRFHMMTKTTTNTKVFALKTAIVPVIAGLMMLLCTKTVAQEKKTETKSTAKPETKVEKVKKQDTKQAAKVKEVFAQQKTERKQAAEQEKKYRVELVTQDPEFPGGLPAFYTYFSKNYVIPAGTKSGKMYFSFVVEEDGSLSNVKVLRDLGPGTGEEGTRVIKASPKWKPAIIEGREKAMNYTLPVMINVGEKGK